MTDKELRMVQNLTKLAYDGTVFISGGKAYKFEYGFLRHMNVVGDDIERLPRSTDDHEPRCPSNYYWSGTCINWYNIIEQEIEFIGTEEEVWHKIQLLNGK